MKSDHTKRKIKDGFLILTGRTPVNKISITSVAAQAEVSRGTFYTHYGNLRTMVEDIGNDMLRDMDLLSRQCPPYNPACPDFSPAEQMANYFQEHRAVFLLLTGEHGDPNFRKKWTEQFRSFLMCRLRESGVSPNGDLERIITFLSHSGIRTICDAFHGSLIQASFHTLCIMDSILHCLAVSQKYMPRKEFTPVELSAFLY